MGCFFSSPILEDTSIIAHLSVRPYIAFRGITRYRNNAPGILYTDGTNLYYEGTCGDKRACCLGCRQSFPLSSITSVTITREAEVAMYFATVPSTNFIKITGPGFLIGVSSSASIKEMEEFVRQLEKLLQHNNNVSPSYYSTQQPSVPPPPYVQ